MTQTQIAWGATTKFVHVVCRLGVVVQDASGDPDAYPDLKSQGGRVDILCSTKRVRYTGGPSSRSISIPDQTYGIDPSTGGLVDAQGVAGLYVLDPLSPGLDPVGFTYTAVVYPVVGESWKVTFGGESQLPPEIDLALLDSIVPHSGDSTLEQRIAALEADTGSGGAGAGVTYIEAYAGLYRVTVGDVALDTIAPTWTATLTTGTPATTSVVVAASALATDDVGVTAYEVSTNGGSTWASITPSGLNFTITGLAASTAYPAPQFRAKDAAGNISTPVLSAQSFTTATPADATPPIAGTLASSAITESGFTLTVTGASDETALHATPYAFSTDNGATWSALQAGATYNATGLAESTAYQARHKVRDAAGNEATGTAITVTTGSSVTPASAYAAAVMTDGPVAFYKLNEAAGATPVDSTGTTTATNSGVTLGATSILTPDTSATNSAASQYISIGNPSAFASATVTTIEAVVKNTTTGGGIVNKSNADTIKGGSFSISGTGTLTMATAPSGSVTTTTGKVLTGQTAHIVVVLDGTNATFYKNGTQTDQIPATGKFGGGTLNIEMARTDQYSGGRGNFTGNLYGVALYNKALAADRILAHAQAAGLA